MFKRLKKKWDSFWESEARKLNQCIGEMYTKKVRESNKDFFDWYEGKINTTEYFTKNKK